MLDNFYATFSALTCSGIKPKIYTTQNKLRVNKLNGSNTNDTLIAYSNKPVYDMYTETHVTSSKNVFHSFSNVLQLYFLNAVDI